MSPNEQHQVCPWCDTEIVWDPELGPEDVCPHCYNELTEYRSLDVAVSSKEGSMEYDDSAEMDEDFEVDFADEDDRFEELQHYERAVEHILERQEDVYECFRCREDMIFTGTRTVTKDQFELVTPDGWSQPLLPTPYTLSMFLCPSCFKVEYTLSDDDRMRWVNHLRHVGNANT